MLSFSIIVAIDNHRGIGKDGVLPWHLPEDLKYFKKITTDVPDDQMQNVVVMGRKTWESIPEKYRPLPGRINVVLSRSASEIPGALVIDSFEKLESLLEDRAIHEVFVIGGAEIFNMAMSLPQCQKLYITQIYSSFDCDTFFPSIENTFQQKSLTPKAISNGLEYSFQQFLPI